MLQLGFPAVQLSRSCQAGKSKRFDFPRSLMKTDNFDFSFSGLKTAVRYAITGPGQQDFSKIEIPLQTKADVCASFEAAAVDVIVHKSSRAVKKLQCQRLIVGGGVAANRYLREQLQEKALADGFELTIAPLNLCTDNAVMGAIALEKIKRNEYAPLDLDITPGLQRGF